MFAAYVYSAPVTHQFLTLCLFAPFYLCNLCNLCDLCDLWTTFVAVLA